tara:strand:- start:346 stop:1257 length:912 start_codon:yes stop_codon:yes gene_type:complete
VEHLWVVIVLISTALQTARNAGQKRLAEKLSAASATWVRFVFGLPVAAIYCMFLWNADNPDTRIFNTEFFQYCLLAAICQLTGTFLLILLFKLRNFAIGSTYVRSEAIIAAFIGAIFFEDILSFSGWIAVGISVVGVVLISLTSLDFKKEQIRSLVFNPSAGIGLLCGLAFGIGSFFIRDASLSLEGLNFLLTSALTLLSVLLFQTAGLGILVVIKTPADIKKMITLWRQCSFVGVTSALGSIGWFTALTIQRVTYVKALAQIEFILALLVSYFIFGEKSPKIEILGMVLVVSGILILLMFAK